MGIEAESAYMALISVAFILAVLFNRGSKPHWFMLKLVGVIASTIPIVGILQGGMFLEKDPPHSRACFLQAAFTITTYFILRYGLDVDMLQF